MSFNLMTLVCNRTVHAGAEFTALVNLAEYANDEGFCWPSLDTLAARCRTTKRCVQRTLSTLVASEELKIFKGAGPPVRGGHLNLYQIQIDVLLKNKVVTEMTEVWSYRTSLNGSCDGDEQRKTRPIGHRGGVQNGMEVTSYRPSKPVIEQVIQQAIESAVHSPLALDSVGQQDQKPEIQPTNEEALPPPKAKRARKVSDAKTFSEWYAERKATGGKILEPDDPSRAYVKTLGLNGDFLEVAWSIFRDDHLISEKKQKSWPQTFLVYLRKGYLRPWFHKDGVWRLTTAGKQAAILIEHDPDMQCGHDDDWTRDVMRGVI